VLFVSVLGSDPKSSGFKPVSGPSSQQHFYFILFSNIILLILPILWDRHAMV
jgi:hypothetical protein